MQNNRLAALSAKGDPLEAIDSLVPWESFRETIEAVVLTSEDTKKSKAGRKPIDAMVMFRTLILQSLRVGSSQTTKESTPVPYWWRATPVGRRTRRLMS